MAIPQRLNQNMKIAIVLGTRPEFIKMAPVVKAFREQLDFFLCHTGQHYSYEMNEVFFKEFELPEPKYHLEIVSNFHGEQTGRMLIEIEKVLMLEKPDLVLVQGDTNTVLAGALAASKLQIDVGHVEAGLRSNDDSMPEEINRILADHVSELLFAPTRLSRQHLLDEGIDADKIHVTGNTIVDVVHRFNAGNIDFSAKNFEFSEKEYMLLTLHRQENVDERERLEGILKGLSLIFSRYNLPILFPIHPRTKKNLERFMIQLPPGVNAINPVGYRDFLSLEKSAALVLTDSGGVQEESCILGTPCVTLRDNTERPETIDVGANIIAGSSPEVILKSVERMMDAEGTWTHPFGDGDSGERINNIIESAYGLD